MGLPQRPGFATDEHDDFSVDRSRWIIRLRWVALSGILVAAVASMLGFFPGVSWHVLVCTVAGASVYNLFLFTRPRASFTTKEAMRQAVVDMGLLTLVLWAAGGMRTPFIGYYVFHIAIVGILVGTRATFVAAIAALVGAVLLLITEHVPALQIGRWDPIWPWDLLAEVAAFTTTVAGVAYLVTHAVRELRLRERALAQARDRAALELEVLSNTLDQLDAGLEVVERDGRVLWRNKRAEELAPRVPAGDLPTRDLPARELPARELPARELPARELPARELHSSDVQTWSCPGEHRPCEKDSTGVCPVRGALDRGEPGRCRFAASVDGHERIYEMNVFPLDSGEGGRPRVMNLYVDRTSGLVAERRLILAERLASLGRVTQGVAHELNTPLATIRTLAADMIAALRAVEDGNRERQSLLDDLRESAALVHDETRRLGRITQGLLTGRDLMTSEIDGSVPLAAVVERARALVFAGARRTIPVEIGEELGDHVVVGDPDHLVQVMVNLLQNAYDAVRERAGGAVRVHARREGARVEIVIDDDGPGLPPEITERLFEPFATTKPPGKGTGLGLYTSYMLVASMNGTLALDTRPEGGARATLSLPAAEPSGARARPDALVRLRKKAGEAAS